MRRRLTLVIADARSNLAEANAYGLSGVAALRLAAALLAAPVTAGMTFFVMYLVLWYGGFNVFNATPPDSSSAIHVAVGLSVYVTILGGVSTGAAVLALIWMATRGPLSFRRVLALGVVLGNLPFAAIVASIIIVQTSQGNLSPDIAQYWDGARGAIRDLAIGSFIGSICAAVFWMMGIYGTDLALRPVSLREPEDDPGLHP